MLSVDTMPLAENSFKNLQKMPSIFYVNDTNNFQKSEGGGENAINIVFVFSPILHFSHLDFFRLSSENLGA